MINIKRLRFKLLTFFLFIDALHDISRLFEQDYFDCNLPLLNNPNTTIANANQLNVASNCQKDRPILAVFLMLITFWLANKLSNLNQKSIFTKSKRDLISDYSLPIAILFFSLIANTVFQVRNLKIKKNALFIHIKLFFEIIQNNTFRIFV